MLRLRESDLSARKEEFVLLTADYQTAGRGQHGTHWEAENGKNLLFGIRFRPERLEASQQFSLSEALALAVADVVGALVPGVTVKWPNDIYVGDRKVCGMLLEHELQGTRIVSTLTGVGLNVNQSRFESDAPNPVSLRQLTGRELDRADILRRIALTFEHYYRLLQGGHYDDVHRRYLMALYRRATWAQYRDAGGMFEGRIVDVHRSGMLCVERRGGRLSTYAFKEVAYII